MVRYMMYMSYIGTRYRGAQKHTANEKVLDIDSIQGAIETGFLSLVPSSLIRPSLTLSSRTDSGVHALCSTAHIELENKYNTIYDTDSILRWMNQYFTHSGHEIRLTSFFPIKDTFHARYNAQSRTYLYRIIFPKRENRRKLPIAELGRSWNLSSVEFNVEKAKAATRLFMGTQNFETFTGKNRTNKPIQHIRKLMELKFVEGEPLMSLDPLAHDFHYWDIVCTARSFLYHQVRRIVAALISVGRGIITERDVNVMLHVPSLQSWPPNLLMAPPHGLYLKEVTYDPVEFALNRIRESSN